MEPGNTLLDDYVLSLTRKERPRVCFLPTASGDADHYIVRFYRAFDAARCEPSHVSLFRRERSAGDVHEQLLKQRPDLRRRRQRDQPARRLARPRARRDAAARLGARRGAVRAQRRLAVLVCRGRDGLPRPAEAVEGLGLLPWSNCVHFDAEPERCRAYRDLLAGGMVEGYAVEDGAALHFEGDRLTRVVGSRPGARAFRMRWTGERVKRWPLPADYLGAAPAVVRAA